MTRSAGDQLEDLKANLENKLQNVQDKIDADTEIKNSLLKELKAITAKLEEVDKRLTIIKGAHKEFTKTMTEIDFALSKINDTAVGIEEKFSKLARLSASPQGDE